MRGKRVQLLSFILIFVISFSAFAPIALAAEASVVKRATLREGPEAGSKSMEKISANTTVTVLDNTSNADWWRVSHKGKEGYIASEYLKMLAPPAEQGYTTRNTQMRAGTSSSSTMMMALPANTPVGVLDKSNRTWWKITCDNTEGYVQASTVKLGTPPESRSSATGGSSGSASAGALSLPSNDANKDKIAKAKGINSDTVGWVKVPHTNIDDPILYRANFYYNDYNIYKKKSLEGVYPYSSQLTRNVVVFGHNLRGSNSGFHQLHHLQEAAQGRSKCQYGKCGRSISNLSGWQNSKEDRTWSISIFGKSKWEVWAMYEVPKNESINTLRTNWNTMPSNLKGWIDNQLQRSEINFGVSVSEKDQIMTVITCGTNYDSKTANSRLFTFLKCVG